MKLDKKKTLIGGLLVLLFSAYLVFEFSKEPHKPNVSVTYLGLTNKIGNGLRAAFAITNQGMSDIRRPKSHTAMQQFKQVPVAHTHPPVRLDFSNTLISPGQAEVFTVSLPGEPGPWRASVAVYSSGSWHELVKKVNRSWARRFIPEGIRRASLSVVTSDWVEINVPHEQTPSPDSP